MQKPFSFLESKYLCLNLYGPLSRQTLMYRSLVSVHFNVPRVNIVPAKTFSYALYVNLSAHVVVPGSAAVL